MMNKVKANKPQDKEIYDFILTPKDCFVLGQFTGFLCYIFVPFGLLLGYVDNIFLLKVHTSITLVKL